MLGAIFGREEPAAVGGAPMSTELFDAMFGG